MLTSEVATPGDPPLVTLSKSPFRGPPLHLLVFAYRNRLTGSVVIDDARREHIVHFMDGAPAKVVTDEHIAPLLDVLERMGLLDAATAEFAAFGLGGAPPIAFARANRPAAGATAKPTAAKAEEDDTPSSAEQKKACDAKWKLERDKTGAKGWKAYFTFMAKCM